MKYVVIIILLVVQSSLAQANEQVPKDLKTSRILLIKYSFKDWQQRYFDSTDGKWITKRYGLDLLYKNYTDAFNMALRVFEKTKVKYDIVDSLKTTDTTSANYVFDFYVVEFSNHTSLIANRHQGGFYFFERISNIRYQPIIENKKYMKKTLRKALAGWK